ncbi:MAG: transglutaminase TgpA family protein, partial [Acidimicrobiales bacterium]
VSPIVDIRGRLVQQADVEAFTVRSDQPSYWRLASLDSFDGQVWGTDTISYGKASGTLSDDSEVNAEVNLLTQNFAISNMGRVWLPAAYEPRVLVEKSEDNIRYDPISGTLLVSNNLDESDGLSYTLESAVPTFDPAALAAAPDEYPPGLFDRYTDLPDEFSPQAKALALDIVAAEGATNDYEKALALQDFFREEFTYDLEVGAGHSSDRIDQFLEAGVGYCEQFAGAFASMARSLDIPARVAVGFTWGELNATDGLYHVRGEHAHAWPEVYIPGSGWVPFEPTPSRGAPNGFEWTGVSQAQANETGLNGDPTPVPAATPIPRDELPQPPADGGTTDTEPLDSSAASNDGIPGWLSATLIAIVVLALLGGLYAFAVINLKRSRTNRRFAAAENNRERVDAVWTETVDSLRPLGLAQQPAETATEFSSRAGKETVTAADPLDKLSTLTVQATYSPSDPDDQAVDSARAHRDDVAQVVQSATTTTDRLKESLDPRPLVKR